MKTFLLKYWWVVAITCAVAALFAASLYRRLPNEDEAIIAEHSYTLGKLGYVKSNMLGGYLEGESGWERRQYFYHKLFVITGAALTSAFGFSIYTFKSVALIFAGIFFVALFFYFKKYYPQHTLPAYLLTCSLLLFSHHFFDHSFMFRPEIMVMCLGFISFYLLRRSLTEGKLYLAALSGMLAGLAAFAHLNGLIYATAGFALLAIRKDVKKALLFSVAAGLFSLLYLFDIHSLHDFQALLHQLQTDPNIAGKENILAGLVNEQKRFFHSPKEVTFTLVFGFALISRFKYLKENFGTLLLYLLLMVVSLGLLAHGKTAKYGLNYYPYMGIVIAAGYAHIRQCKLPVKLLGYFLLAAFICVQAFYNLRLMGQRIDIAAHNAALSAYIPEKNVKISAPGVFAFNEIHRYTVRAEIAWSCHYEVFHRQEKKLLNSYLAFAKENGDKYVLIDKATTCRPEVQAVFRRGLSVADTIGAFRVIAASNDVVVLENLTSE